MSLTSYCHRGAEGAESNKMHEAIKVFISVIMIVKIVSNRAIPPRKSYLTYFWPHCQLFNMKAKSKVFLVIMVSLLGWMIVKIRMICFIAEIIFEKKNLTSLISCSTWWQTAKCSWTRASFCSSTRPTSSLSSAEGSSPSSSSSECVIYQREDCFFTSA